MISVSDVKIPEPAPYGAPMERDVWVYHMFRNVLQVLALTPEETVRAFPENCAVLAETIFGNMSHHESPPSPLWKAAGEAGRPEDHGDHG
jgi:hypothetical protein